MGLFAGHPRLRGGSRQRLASAAAFEALAPASPWRHVGLLEVTVAGLILAYYAVIAGWVLKYLSLHLTGST